MTILLPNVKFMALAIALCFAISGSLLSQPLSPAMVGSMAKYDITQMKFNLHAESNTKHIEGYTTIRAKAIAALDTFAFRLHSNYAIDSILIDGVKQDSLRRNVHDVRVAVKASVGPGKYFAAQIFYHGTAPGTSNTWGEGLVSDTSVTGKHYTYTLSCPYFMYQWTPCKEVLDDLIDSVSMTITTDTANKVGSNGLLIRDSVIAGGKHVVSWVTHYPTNYYLICFNLGSYIEYQNTCTIGINPGFPVINFAYDSARLKSGRNIYDTLPFFLQHYSQLFGLYPFCREKFGTVMTQLAGGMEHQSFVNLGVDGFTKYLAAHEMSHQWWGDNVVLKNLRDVWLNEGFAAYCEYLTSQYFYQGESKAYFQNIYSNALIAGGASRVCRKDTSNFHNIYTYNEVYEKGAVILNTLRYLISSDTMFFGALTHYQSHFSHKNVTVNDFKSFMATYTAQNFDTFFNQWYYGYGYPIYDLQWNQWNHTLTIVAKHKGSCPLTKLFTLPVEYLISRASGGDTVIKVNQKTNADTFDINIHGATVTDITLDPNQFVLNKVRTKMHNALLGVENIGVSNTLTVSPTLFNNRLNVRSSLNKSFNLEVYDVSGRLMYSGLINTDNFNINTSAWATGIYFVKVTDQDKVYLNKLVKGN